MEAPIPRSIRSKTPSRRERPCPELSRAVFSDGEMTRLDRSADDKKREQHVEDDEENDEEGELLRIPMVFRSKLNYEESFIWVQVKLLYEYSY